ncbi:hypothetical protein Scep_015352 [Stephania cephalantha]|uniref:AT-hook motif nuclear-localized protein n=1 Tax=Stephania cephalantha TaxID=152367 RepID=A0AAP0P3U6_9MAGN
MEEPRSPNSLNIESNMTGKLSQTINSKMESSVGKSMERGNSSTPSMKRKRGRPKKIYVHSGAMAPNGSPIRSSSPLSLSFKRSRGRPRGSSKHIDASFGEGVDDSTGDNFLPHVIIVNRGEDVVGRISSFCQQGPRSICILSAHGTISHVIVRQAISCSSTMTYEGLFEILSLSGSFTVTARGRSGGLSITLAGPDDRVFGGLVAGSLIAASTVQVEILMIQQVKVFCFM